MDKQRRAQLLRDVFDEQSIGEVEAIYEGRAKEQGCDYIPGSLCELEMIEQCFKGKKSVSVHVLTDEWSATKLDKEGVLRAGSDTAQVLEGTQFFVEKGDYHLPTHGRAVRSVRAWIACQFLIMRGCPKPWLKAQRNDSTVPILHPRELIQRYFFAGMQWDNRLIQTTYFNLEARKVFFHFCPPG